MFNLPYHLVWTVGTADKVLIYTTKSEIPLYVVSNIHYGDLTDFTWFSSSTLGISSMDGYISFAFFSKEDFGEELEAEAYPPFMKENQAEYERVRGLAAKERLMVKKNMVINEQENYIKDGKKMVNPKKIITVTEEQPIQEASVNGMAEEKLK